MTIIHPERAPKGEGGQHETVEDPSLQEELSHISIPDLEEAIEKAEDIIKETEEKKGADRQFSTVDPKLHEELQEVVALGEEVESALRDVSKSVAHLQEVVEEYKTVSEANKNPSDDEEEEARKD